MKGIPKLRVGNDARGNLLGDARIALHEEARRGQCGGLVAETVSNDLGGQVVARLGVVAKHVAHGIIVLKGSQAADVRLRDFAREGFRSGCALSGSGVGRAAWSAFGPGEDVGAELVGRAAALSGGSFVNDVFGVVAARRRAK